MNVPTSLFKPSPQHRRRSHGWSDTTEARNWYNRRRVDLELERIWLVLHAWLSALVHPLLASNFDLPRIILKDVQVHIRDHHSIPRD